MEASGREVTILHNVYADLKMAETYRFVKQISPVYSSRRRVMSEKKRNGTQRFHGLAFTIIISSAIVFLLCGTVFSENLNHQQGRYWKWSAPQGWRHSESLAGVTLTSPDGKYEATLAGLMRSQGHTTPKAFLQRMLGMAYSKVTLVAVRQLPNQKMGYQSWNWIEAEVTAISKSGSRMKGVWRCGVANYYNMNDALVNGWWSPVSGFQQSKNNLEAIAKSIILTNPNEAFGNNQLVHPSTGSSAGLTRNNPNTTGDMIMKTWENKNKAYDESMRNDTNVRRGYEPAYDPSTGQQYNPNLSKWDSTKGGYVNPNRPTELLNCGTPEDPKPCTSR